MCREVGTTLVERERPPSSTERRDTPVGVLQIDQPSHACGGGGPDVGVFASIAILGATEGRQRQERAARVIAVRDAPAQIGPGPAAGSRLRIRMHDGVLLVQQPAGQIRSLLPRERLGAKRVDGQRGQPGGQIRVDGPAAILADRSGQKVDAPSRDGMIPQPDAGQAHRHETGQRRGFEEAAGLGLDRFEDPERPGSGHPAQETGHGVTTRAMVMLCLSDGNQRGQRVADDRQAHPLEPGVGQRRQLEREGRDVLPPEPPRQGAVRQDGDRERPVFAIGLADRGRHRLRRDLAHSFAQPGFGAPRAGRAVHG